MRVVLDTNVLISGLLWSGLPSRCVAVCLDRIVDLVTADEILTELRGKLVGKFHVTDAAADDTVTRFRRSGTVVALTGRHGWVLTDPDDDKFVEAALLGKAEAIVSGDHDLRDLGTVAGIPVWSPREMLEHLAAP